MDFLITLFEVLGFIFVFGYTYEKIQELRDRYYRGRYAKDHFNNTERFRRGIW